MVNHNLNKDLGGSQASGYRAGGPAAAQFSNHLFSETHADPNHIPRTTLVILIKNDVFSLFLVKFSSFMHSIYRCSPAHSSAPTWKTATASTHATASCTPTAAAARRPPICRTCSATVARHGV